MIDLKALRIITRDGLRAFALGRVLDGIAALRTLLPYCAEETIVGAEADSLEKNYHYMLSFLRSGGDDEKRSEVQAKIQLQGIALLEQANRAIRLKLNKDQYSKVQETLIQNSKSQIPNDSPFREYVVDTWNSLLTPEETGEAQDNLFDFLWTSPFWSPQDTAYWYDFLLRQRDMVQQHLAGAVFLSLWEHYDAEKMQLLGLLADSECHRTHISIVVYLLLLRLRHKELVPLMPPLPDSLLSPKGRKQIAEVQYEMLLMLVSEKDMEKELKEAEGITNDIMQSLAPALSKGDGEKPISITPSSLDERASSFVSSVKSIISLRGRYLRNRLQRGLDINLSKVPLLHACKYMRRVSHWFLPFDKTHPLFQSVMIDEKGNEKRNLSSLTDLILDCDVDKLAMLYLVSNDKDFSKAVQQLDDQEIPGLEEAEIPEYTFRSIMQDLFRFFGHSPIHSQLTNPFREELTLLDFPELASLFSSEDCTRCCNLLFELGRDKQVLDILDDSIKRDGATAQALLLKGNVLKKQKHISEAISCARSAEILEPDNTDILRFLIECYILQNRHEEELEYLHRLIELVPENKKLNRLVASATDKAGRKEEALQLFFKLDYELTEDDEDRGIIISSIANIALALDKLDIAERYTEKGLEMKDERLASALLRMGHIKLLQGDWKNAISHYEQFINAFCQKNGQDIGVALAEFNKSQEMLVSKGIKKEDLLLIHDILQAASESPKG